MPTKHSSQLTFISSLLPWALILLAVPWAMFTTNLLEFAYSPNVVYPFWYSFALIALILYSIKAHSRAEYFDSFACYSFWFGVFIAVESIASEQTEVKLMAPSFAGGLFSFFLFLIILVFSRVRFFRELHRFLGGLFTILFVAFSFFNLPTVWKQLRWQSSIDANTQASVIEKLAGATDPRLPNIYQFVFDTYSGPFLNGYLKENPQKASAFAGFTYFQQARSNFLNTTGSTQSFLTGSFPNKTNNSVSEWIEQAKTQAMPSLLKKIGYQSIQYVASAAYNPSPDSTEIPLSKIASGPVWIVHFARLCDYVLIRSLPRFLKPLAVVVGEAGPLSNFLLQKEVIPYPPSHELSQKSVAVVENFLEQEKHLSAKGRYTYVHLMLPHGPASWSSECRNVFAPETSENLKKSGTPLDLMTRAAYQSGRFYSEQALMASHFCATKIMLKIIDELKRLQRFESSMIVIQSDHGTSRNFFGPAYRIESSFSNLDEYRQVESSNLRKELAESIDYQSRPLLLIKRPGELSDSMMRSDKSVQLVDLPNTVFSQVSATTRAPEGQNIYSSELLADRWIPIFTGIFQSDQDGNQYLFWTRLESGFLDHFEVNPSRKTWRVLERIAVRK